MPIKTHFVLKGLQRVRVDEYLERELKRAGYGGVDIQKTPLGTRFTIYATRPGFVIGRRGKTVRELTESLKQAFAVDNPQIEVAEVEIPEFDAKIMASKLASSLERGFQYRRAVYSVLRRIMEAGAKGTEITISGKLSSQRARYQKFKDGVVTKSGEPVKTFVREATSPAFMKPGVMGVRVVIMLPGELPDKIKVKYPEIVQPAAQPPAAKPELPKEEAPKTQETIVNTETKPTGIGPEEIKEGKAVTEIRETQPLQEPEKAAQEAAKEPSGKKPREKKESKKSGRKKEKKGK
ncbi:MAG: 30S ribosomal protein S3 [Promethearchaeati archaeon SRVP18_Atabeyarchaeia-1]